MAGKVERQGSAESTGPPVSEGAPVALSASSINTFLRCGRQWFYAYVAGIKSPPSLKAARGIAVHSAVELNMSQKIETRTDLPMADVLDAYSDSYEREIDDGFQVRPDEDPGEIKDAGVGLVKVYHTEVAPDIQPAIVEKPVRFKINGQDYTGQIDLGEMVPINLHGEPEYRMLLRDTKTTSRAPDPSQYMLNMTGYALSSRQELGEEEAGVVFDYLVATKKPRYEPIRSGPVTDEQVRAFATVVGDVSEAIKAGKFVPNGLTARGVCDWCGYQDICTAYIKKDINR